MALTLIAPPTEEPLSLDDLKSHLRVSWNDEDDLITSLGIAARQLCETTTRRQFVTATWKLTIDTFTPSSASCGQLGSLAMYGMGSSPIGLLRYPLSVIYLPAPPLQSVTSLSYIDTTGATSTLAANTDYLVDTASEPGRVTPAYGKVWPWSQSRINAVNITYVAGYGAAITVPQGLKHAIRLMVGHWYINREAVSPGSMSSVPDSARALLGSFDYGSYV